MTDRRRWLVAADGIDVVWFFRTRRGARNHRALLLAALPPSAVVVARHRRDGTMTIHA